MRKNSIKISFNSLTYQTWLKLFLGLDEKLDPKRECFGNATLSTIKAYGLDEKNQYNSTSVIGCENLKKLKNAGLMILEKHGYTFEN